MNKSRINPGKEVEQGLMSHQTHYRSWNIPTKISGRDRNVKVKNMRLCLKK